MGTTSDNRYATEAAVSQKEFPAAQSAANVIVTRGDIIPDGITASFLSKTLNAPILLIGPPGSSSLPSETVTEIQRVLAQGGNIYVLGDDNSVDSNARGALSSLVNHGGTVINVDGTGTTGNRFISSADHATTAFTAPTGSNPVSTFDAGGGAGALRTAFFANGFTLIDALCAGQLAYVGFPVFLVANDGTLDGSVSNAITALGIQQGITLGDANSIAAPTTTAIAAQTGHPVINRSGANRFATCATLANMTLGGPVSTTNPWAFGAPTNMIMTLGLPRANDPNPPSSLVDSISAGTLGGRKKWPVVLASTGGLPTETANFLAAHSAPVTDLWVPGSNASTPDAEVTQAQGVLQTGFVAGSLSSISVTPNLAQITATFSSPVWSAAAQPALTSDFEFATGGIVTDAAPMGVSIATTAATASPTVTLTIPTADKPTAANPNVYLEYNGNGTSSANGIVDGNGVVPTTSNAHVSNATATTISSLAVVGTPTGAGDTATLSFSQSVGLCTGGGGAGSGTPVATGTSVVVITPPATTPTPAEHATAATSVTSPAQAADVVVAAGTPSTAIAFTVTPVVPTGSSVALLVNGPVFASLCDFNGNPITGGQNGFASAS